MRSKNIGGGGNLPNANGVAVIALLQLAELLNKPEFSAVAIKTLESLAGLMAESAYSSEYLLLALADHLRGSAGEPPAPGTEGVRPVAFNRVEPVTIRAYTSHSRVEPGDSFELSVTIDIDEGWHLYGDNPDAKFLVPSTIIVEPSILSDKNGMCSMDSLALITSESSP